MIVLCHMPATDAACPYLVRTSCSTSWLVIVRAPIRLSPMTEKDEKGKLVANSMVCGNSATCGTGETG